MGASKHKKTRKTIYTVLSKKGLWQNTAALFD